MTTASVPLCAHCGGPVVETVCGWTHVEYRGQLLSWLCPMPHMTLATATVDAPASPDREPAWVEAARVPMSRHARPPELPDAPV